jgi:uncharacterized protein (TIGR03437 family)
MRTGIAYLILFNAVLSAAVPQSQTIQDFGPIPDQLVGATLVIPEPYGSAGSDARVDSNTSVVCQTAGSGGGKVILRMNSAGLCSLTARTLVRTPEQLTWPSARKTQVFVVRTGSTPQTIQLDPIPDQTVAPNGRVSVRATASSGLLVIIRATGGCEMEGATTVVIRLAGLCRLSATQDGNGTFAPAPIATRFFRAYLTGTAPQTISVEPLQDVVIGTPPFEISLRPSGAFTTTSDTPAVCAIEGLLVFPLAMGRCTLRVATPAFASYAAGPTLIQSFNVFAAGSKPQTIQFSAIPDHPKSSESRQLSFLTTSGLPALVTSSTPEICATFPSGTGYVVGEKDFGWCTLTAIQPGNATWAAAPPVSQTYFIGSAGTVLQTLDPIDDQELGAPFFGSASFESAWSLTLDTCDFTLARTIRLRKPGTCTVGSADSQGIRQPVTRSFQILPVQRRQAIEFNSIPDMILGTSPVQLGGSGPFPPFLSGSSPLPVSLVVSTPSVCILRDNSIFALNAGTCTIIASQAGDEYFAPADTVIRSFSVIRDTPGTKPQTISFPPISEQAFGTLPFSLTASSSSGRPVTFVATPESICSVTGSVITLLQPGECTVVAAQSGDNEYAPAPTVTRTFTIGLVPRLAQTITFDPIPGQRLSSNFVNARPSTTSNLEVTLTSGTPSVCTGSSPIVLFRTTGLCTVTASQPGNHSYAAAATVTRSFQIFAGLLQQTLTWPQLDDQKLESPPLKLTARASSGLPITYLTTQNPEVCRIDGDTVILLKTGYCFLQALQPGNDVYAPVSLNNVFRVRLELQEINLPDLPDRSLDDPVFTVNVTASSGLPVTLRTQGPCSANALTITLNAVGYCVVRATQAGDDTWDPTSAETAFTIVPRGVRIQTITFPPIPDRRLEDGPFTPQATASSGLPVIFRIAYANGCTVLNNVVTIPHPGYCAVLAEQPGDATTAPARPVTQLFNIFTTGPTAPIVNAVVNAASYATGPLATGSYATIFGSRLTPTPQIKLRDSTGNLYPGIVYFSNPTQTNFVVPPGAAPGPATLTVVVDSQIVETTVTLARVSPGLFTFDSSGKGFATGQVLVPRPSGITDTYALGTSPIPVNGASEIFLVLYGTGLRNAPPGSGTATLAGRPMEVLYAGPQTQYDGLDQVNLRISLQGMPPGTSELKITLNGVPANPVTIALP